MKLISILVPEHAISASITDAKRLFDVANEFLKQDGKKPIFLIQLVGFTKEVYVDGGLICIKADKILDEVVETDLIIVPAVGGDVIRATQLNRQFFPWLTSQYKKGAEIASFCVGAFIVAATGLLKGKECSTHWMYANEFRVYYPDIKLVDDKIVTEQSGIYSSGGGTSYWNLLLYLLEKYTNRQIVIAITKYFLLDIQRNSQSSFVMFKGQKEHGDELVKQVQLFIENNCQEKFNIESMSTNFSIVRRTLERRFKKATKNSLVEYIQRIKIEAAKKQIELGRKTINEIMYEVGYSDVKAFRDLFTKIAGLTPVEYRHRYNKMAMEN
jgi:transcriptional regulator GlxA family with amidase domain